MSQTHPTAAELDRFIMGELDDDDAVRLAVHLDGCPACATHVATRDPLFVAFASLDDPEPPPELVEALVAQTRESRNLGPEPLIAGVLIAMSTFMLVAAGGPVQSLAGMASTVRALATAANALLDQGGAALIVAWVGTATLLLAASLASAASPTLRRPA